MSNAQFRSEAGMVGKAAVIWVALLAVLAIGALDAVSIARTTLRLSEIATEAAASGEEAFRTAGRSTVAACEAATAVVAAHDPGLRLGQRGCLVDPATGRVTITLRATADTIIAGRFSPTTHYTHIVVTEAKGRASL
jgi:hypothetical protein